MDMETADMPEHQDAAWITVLDKAIDDYFDYLLRLQTGEIIHFCQARDHGEFIALVDCRIMSPLELVHCYFKRDMEIRKDAIVWIADAGYINGI